MVLPRLNLDVPKTITPSLPRSASVPSEAPAGAPSAPAEDQLTDTRTARGEQKPALPTDLAEGARPKGTKSLARRADRAVLRKELTVTFAPAELERLSFSKGKAIIDPDLDGAGGVSDRELGLAVVMALELATRLEGEHVLSVDKKGRLVLQAADATRACPFVLAAIPAGAAPSDDLDLAAIRQSFEAHKLIAKDGMGTKEWRKSKIALDTDRDGRVSAGELAHGVRLALRVMDLRPGDEYVTVDGAGNLLIAKHDASLPSEEQPAMLLPLLDGEPPPEITDTAALRQAYEALLFEAKLEQTKKGFWRNYEQAQRDLAAGKTESAMLLFDKAERYAQKLPEPLAVECRLQLRIARAAGYYGARDLEGGDAQLALLKQEALAAGRFDAIAPTYAKLEAFAKKLEKTSALRGALGAADEALAQAAEAKPGSAEQREAGAAALASVEGALAQAKRLPGADASLIAAITYKQAMAELFSGNADAAAAIFAGLTSKGTVELRAAASVMLVEAFRQAGKTKEAVLAAKKFYEGTEGAARADALRLYLRTLATAGRDTEAKVVLKDLVKDGSPPERALARLLFAELALRQNDVPAASASLRAITSDPEAQVELKEQARALRLAIDASYLSAIEQVYDHNISRLESEKERRLEPSGLSLLNPVTFGNFVLEGIAPDLGHYGNALDQYEAVHDRCTGERWAVRELTKRLPRLPSPHSFTSLCKMSRKEREQLLVGAPVNIPREVLPALHRVLDQNPDAKLLAAGDHEIGHYGREPYVDTSFMLDGLELGMKWVGEVTVEARAYDEQLKKSRGLIDRAVGYSSAAVLDAVSMSNDCIKTSFHDAKSFWAEVAAESDSGVVKGAAFTAFALANTGDLLSVAATAPLTLADYRATLDMRTGAAVDTFYLLITAGVAKGIKGVHAPRWLAQNPVVVWSGGLAKAAERGFAASAAGRGINGLEGSLAKSAFGVGMDRGMQALGRLARLEVKDLPELVRRMARRPKMHTYAPGSPAAKLTELFDRPLPAETRAALNARLAELDARWRQLQASMSDKELTAMRGRLLEQGKTASGTLKSGHGHAADRALANQNWDDAITKLDQWTKAKEPFTMERLRELNETLTRGMDLQGMGPVGGQVRGKIVDATGQPLTMNKQYVLGGNSPAKLYAMPEDVSNLLDDFFSWYQAAEASGMHPIELAARSYERLVSIHPFMDANGRTCRLAMEYILGRHGYPPAVMLGENVNVAVFALLGENNLIAGASISKLEAGLNESLRLATAIK